MDITFTIPNAQGDNICAWYKYDANKLPDETKPQFIKRVLKQLIKNDLTTHERISLVEAARAQASVIPSDIVE